jgi:hypothetical protein
VKLCHIGAIALGAVSFALKGNAYILAIVYWLVISLTMLDQGNVDHAKAIQSHLMQYELYLAPLTLLVGSYTFRWLLAGQPNVSTIWVREAGHVLHLSYLFALLFWPSLLCSIGFGLSELRISSGRMGDIGIVMVTISALWSWALLFVSVARLSKLLRASRSAIFISLYGAYLITLAALAIAGQFLLG